MLMMKAARSKGSASGNGRRPRTTSLELVLRIYKENPMEVW